MSQSDTIAPVLMVLVVITWLVIVTALWLAAGRRRPSGAMGFSRCGGFYFAFKRLMVPPGATDDAGSPGTAVTLEWLARNELSHPATLDGRVLRLALGEQEVAGQPEPAEPMALAPRMTVALVSRFVVPPAMAADLSRAGTAVFITCRQDPADPVARTWTRLSPRLVTRTAPGD